MPVREDCLDLRELLSVPYLLEAAAVETAPGKWLLRLAYPELPDCTAEGFVLDHPRRLGSGELGLLGAARRSRNRHACCLGLGDETCQPLRGGDEDGSRPEQLGTRDAGARGAPAHPAA